MVYASLIEALALLPVFFLTGLTGAFFRPLADVVRARRARVDAGRADHHAGAELHPAAATPRSERRESPIVALAAARRTGGCSRRSSARPRPAYVAVAVIVLAGHPRRAPARAGAAARSFKERDFLMHWVTKPDTSNEEEVRISVRGARRSCWRSPASATSAPTSARPSWPTSRTASTSARTGSASTSRPTTTRRSPRCRRWSTATRASDATCRPISRSGSARCSPARARPSSCTSSATTSTRSQDTADDVKDMIGNVDGVIEENVELQDEVPQVEVKVDLDGGGALRPEAGRRPARGRHVRHRRGGRRHLPRRARPTTCRSGARPSRRNSLTAIQQLPIDTPDGGRGRPRGGGRRGDQAAAQLRSTARTCRGPSRSAPTSRAGTSDPWPRTSRTGSRR